MTAAPIEGEHPVLIELGNLDAWSKDFHSQYVRGSERTDVGYSLGAVRDKMVEEGLARNASHARTLIADAEEQGLVVLYGEGQARKVATKERYESAQDTIRWHDQRQQRLIDAINARYPRAATETHWTSWGVHVTTEALEALIGISPPPTPDTFNDTLSLFGVPRR